MSKRPSTTLREENKRLKREIAKLRRERSDLRWHLRSVRCLLNAEQTVRGRLQTWIAGDERRA